MPQIPHQPEMPNQADQYRSVHTAARELILNEDHEEILIEWMQQFITDERLEQWGPPDTSANPIADIARQLSSPGLYGERPSIFHPAWQENPLIAQVFGEGGLLDRAGYFTRMQEVQFYTEGLGDYVLTPNLEKGGDIPSSTLNIRSVSPHLLYARGRTVAPDKPELLAELRLRHVQALDTMEWCWDVYDLTDGSYSARLPKSTRDESPGEFGDARDYTGDAGRNACPRSRAGDAVLPYVIYRSADSGKLWSWHRRRGAHRGTLNAGLNWSYANHGARDASGRAVIAAGLIPLSGDTSGPANRIQIELGSIIYHEVKEGVQPFVQEIGPGGNVEDLLNYATSYEHRQAVRWGLNPSDVLRQSANPMSGASLLISEGGKRRHQAKVEPLYRKADLEFFRLVAILVREAGLGEIPEDGYSIVYSRIPASPTEQKDQREQLDWDAEKGIVSPIDVYQARNPGTSREAAIEAIAQARVDKQSVAQRIAELGGAASTDREGLLDVLERFQAGRLGRKSAHQVLVSLFHFTKEQAESFLG